VKEKIISIHDFEPVLAAGLGGRARKIEIPRNFLFRALMIVTTALLADDGGGAAPVYAQDAHLRMMDRVQLKTDADMPINANHRALVRSVLEPMHGVEDDFILDPAAGTIGADHTIVHTTRIPFCDETPGTSKTAQVATMLRSWARKTLDFSIFTPANVDEMLVNGMGGVVTLTELEYRVYAHVYELTSAEQAMFDKSTKDQLRMIDDFEQIAAARAYAPFLNKDLDRGEQVLSIGLMATDDGVRDPLQLETVGLQLANLPNLPEAIPTALLKSMNVLERRYDAPDGIYWIDLDGERSHASAPKTTNLEQFRLPYSAAGPAGAPGTFAGLNLVMLERGNAKYVGG